MTASQLRPRISWSPPRSWNLSTYWPVILMLAAPGIWTFDLAREASAPSKRQLSTTCDRVVERLLTTHDSVELERSRVLVNVLDYDVPHRLSHLPARQAEGLDL